MAHWSPEWKTTPSLVDFRISAMITNAVRMTAATA